MGILLTGGCLPLIFGYEGPFRLLVVRWYTVIERGMILL